VPLNTFISFSNSVLTLSGALVITSLIAAAWVSVSVPSSIDATNSTTSASVRISRAAGLNVSAISAGDNSDTGGNASVSGALAGAIVSGAIVVGVVVWGMAAGVIVVLDVVVVLLVVTVGGWLVVLVEVLVDSGNGSVPGVANCVVVGVLVGVIVVVVNFGASLVVVGGSVVVLVVVLVVVVLVVVVVVGTSVAPNQLGGTGAHSY
jgi:hypothetical protein